MKVIRLIAEKRDSVGKSSTKQLRKEGKVPVVFYGGKEHYHLAIYEADFKNLVYTPNSYIVQMAINGEHKLCVLKDIQFHPVSENIIHADFMQVFEDQPVIINIPIKVQGSAPGVIAGGKLMVKMRKMSVKGYLKDLPDYLVADINNLQIGKSVRVKDIVADNLTKQNSPEISIVSCVMTRASISAAAQEAEDAK